MRTVRSKGSFPLQFAQTPLFLKAGTCRTVEVVLGGVRTAPWMHAFVGRK